MGIIYIAPPKEKNTSDSRLREWSGRTSQPQQGYPEVMAKSWSKKKNIAKYVVVEVWTIHTYIYIYILRIENNKSWFVNHQYTVCQKYVKHRSHMLGFMEIEGKLTTNCCAQRAKNCRLRLCYSGSIKVAQHICYMSNTSLNVIELPRLWMHVSPASVVKFVGMIFPCLCETPVTSCAKQGTKKNKRNTSKLICYFA